MLRLGWSLGFWPCAGRRQHGICHLIVLTLRNCGGGGMHENLQCFHMVCYQFILVSSCYFCWFLIGRSHQFHQDLGSSCMNLHVLLLIYCYYTLLQWCPWAISVTYQEKLCKCTFLKKYSSLSVRNRTASYQVVCYLA